VATITDIFEKTPKPLKDPKAFLNYSILTAHEQIVKKGKEHTPPLKPCTTAVVCVVQNGRAWWAHVGDSRLYLFRYGEPAFITKDHSYVEHLKEKGLITPEEALTHPKRNQITRCVGARTRTLEITYGHESTLGQGDILLLCSDGLWGSLEDKVMGQQLLKTPFDKTLQELIEMGEKAGGPKSDNTTGVALRWMSVASLYETAEDTPRKEIEEEVEEVVVDEAVEPEDLNELDAAIQILNSTFDEYEEEFSKKDTDSSSEEKEEDEPHNNPDSAKETL
jgi:serine/threonine protein phosphatase PrpC